MRFMSFLRFLTNRWGRGKPSPIRRKQRAQERLLLEALERRDLLAGTPPTLLAVPPPDGAAVAPPNPPPQTPIQILFSEPMTASAANASNYLLEDSAGHAIPINSATLNGSSTIVTLTYNGGNPLFAGTYTLLVHGDKLLDVDDGLPIAQPGQVFVANAGQNNLSVVNLTGDGTLGALSNYPLPAIGATQPAPVAVAHADLDGDGLPDLIVANSATNELAIYRGRALANGLGFDLNPDLRLALPAGASPDSVAIADLTGDGLPDVAVANRGTNNVTIFTNIGGNGTLAFSTGVNVAAGV